MTDLSPAAQAVLDAVEDDCIHPDDKHRIAAAALRTVSNDWRTDTEWIEGVEYIRTTALEAIAAELEGVND